MGAMQKLAGLMRRAIEKYDMILSPVAPTVAYKIGENSSDPLKMYL